MGILAGVLVGADEILATEHAPKGYLIAWGIGLAIFAVVIGIVGIVGQLLHDRHKQAATSAEPSSPSLFDLPPGERTDTRQYPGGMKTRTLGGEQVLAGPAGIAEAKSEAFSPTVNLVAPPFVANLPPGEQYSASAWSPQAPGDPTVFRAEILRPSTDPKERERFQRHVVDVANRVIACAPEGHKQAPFPYPSSDRHADMASFAAAYRRGARISRRQGRMTNRRWKEVRETIEALREGGYHVQQLTDYLENRPRPDQCVHLGSELNYLVSPKS
jgi:hypothetical protein